jgi:hypothetical protein
MVSTGKKRRSISKLQMDSSVKVRLEQRQTRSVKIVRGVKARMLFVTVYFNV